ncbi:hypothetical protein [Muricomes intestini]|uniref:hypothetical protein n=1 Tax=Muricomes intestini TaxID=1796634 RepID=UPI002FE2D412
MRLITKKFFDTSLIEKNEDTIAAMDFLCNPENVQKMINASESHYPALSAVVAELEEKFADSEGFPLHHDAPDKNAKNRRNVGWMVRFIMREFGYAPIEKSDRTRIGSNSGSKYFGNASLYEKVNENANYVIVNSAYVVGCSWSITDMRLSKDDEKYEEIKKNTKKLKKRMKNLGISNDFMLNYLHRIGFNNLISLAELMSFLNGILVPCIELYETMDFALNMFELFEGIMEKRKQSAKKACADEADQ